MKWRKTRSGNRRRDSGRSLTLVILRYRLKNGTNRPGGSTLVPVEAADGAMESLSRDPAFREQAYPLADRNTENVTDVSSLATGRSFETRIRWSIWNEGN